MSYRTKTDKLQGGAVLAHGLRFGAGTMTVGSAVLIQFSECDKETDERRDRRTDRRSTMAKAALA